MRKDLNIEGDAGTDGTGKRSNRNGGTLRLPLLLKRSRSKSNFFGVSSNLKTLGSYERDYFHRDMSCSQDLLHSNNSRQDMKNRTLFQLVREVDAIQEDNHHGRRNKVFVLLNIF